MTNSNITPQPPQPSPSEVSPVPQPTPVTPSLQPSPTTNPVEQNYLARQVLKAQDRIQEHFPYNASFDAVYWINGAVTICKHANVRDDTAISRILTSELWNCTPIQASIENHLEQHHSEHTIWTPLCLTRLCLKDSSIYTKPTSVITSALARYQKPSEMDVKQHLVAHIQKEEDLLRRRNPDITNDNIKLNLYGSTLSDGSHSIGACEDSEIAWLLDSLLPTEPFLMDHLNILELLRTNAGWTLNELINAIRAYERKMHESYHTDSKPSNTAILSHYKAKIQSRDSSALHTYEHFDPTRYKIFLGL